jgi:solute carrier family 35 (adenosine 3'-phospho 5'-phosphosulfate transporter), member B3
MIIMELAVESLASNYQYKLAGGTLPTLITLTQFIWCMLLPLMVKPATVKTVNFSPVKIGPYITMSFVVACATGLATASLRYVAYPVKIVFKSTKLIPTMVVSAAMLGNVHSIGDYMAAALLCVGTALFIYHPDKTVGDAMHNSSTFGCFLLLVSVVFDSLLPNVQKKMMARVSPEELMVNTNLVGSLGMLAYICIFSENIDRIFAYFASSDDSKMALVLQLCIVGASLSFAVLCYTSLIQETGPVVAVTVSTIRKVVTIVLSYVVFPKPLGWRELTALVLIGLGIFVENFWKRIVPAAIQDQGHVVTASSHYDSTMSNPGRFQDKH